MRGFLKTEKPIIFALIAVRHWWIDEERNYWHESAGVIVLNEKKEDFKFVKEFHLPGDSCRRGSDHHLWHLYLTKINSEKEILRLNDESNNFLWLKPDEIKSRKDIVYPLKYILENIEI